MTDEKLVNAMNDARLISACDNVIFPILQLRIENRIKTACAAFRAGQREFSGDIAYIAGLQDLMSDLSMKINQGNKAIQILHERNNKP